MIANGNTDAVMLQACFVMDAMVWIVIGTQIMMVSSMRFSLCACCTHECRSQEGVCQEVVGFLKLS